MRVYAIQKWWHLFWGLQLEFYKLQKTSKENIGLSNGTGVYDPEKANSSAVVPEPKEPLDEIIDRLNKATGGNFTESNKVIYYILHSKLSADKKLRKAAKSSDPQVFMESIFPKLFDTVAQDSYVEQTETFTELFKNKNKYYAIMAVLAELLYREFNKQ